MARGPSINGKCLSAAFLVLAALALIACGGGEQTPGENPPKRSLDPRSEAVRYFPTTTEAIALVQTADPEALATLNQAMAKHPAWQRSRDRAARSLQAAGIDPNEILALSRQPADDIELPDPEIAIGTVPGSGAERDRVLLTLATEQGVNLDETFKAAADSGGLEAAGEFDGARLYRGQDLDFAVRDGVLIAASDLNRLQQAIARRDGDREFQLDDAPMTALFNQLPDNATLRAYSGESPATESLFALLSEAMAASSGTSGTQDETNEKRDPGDSATATADPEPDATEAALTARVRDGSLALDIAIAIEKPEQLTEETPAEEPAPDEEPLPITISPAQIESGLASLPPDSPLRGLSHLGPLAGAAWIDDDLLRARLITSD